MYPYLRLLTTLWKARRQPALDIDDVSRVAFRAGPGDIDVFGELNNARQLVFFELGRWDYSQRVGFIPIMRKKRWGLVVGGASIRYRRRVPFMQRFTVTTRMLCHDQRWFYFLQEIHRDDQVCSSGLLKAGVTSRDGLVPAGEVAAAMGQPDWGNQIPPWVQAWIDAEGQRPWPSQNSGGK
jgi:acyl-CoA thioesterase FadM